VFTYIQYAWNLVFFIFRGLKDLVTPVLAGILESEPANAMSFEEFFARIQDILSRKVIASVKNIILLYSRLSYFLHKLSF